MTSAYEFIDGFRCPKCNKQIKNKDNLAFKYNQMIKQQLDRIEKIRYFNELSKNIEAKEREIKSDK